MSDSSCTQGIKTVSASRIRPRGGPSRYTGPTSACPAERRLVPTHVGYEAAGQQIGLVPGRGPQDNASPVAYWHVADIEAKLDEVTAAGAAVKEPARDVGRRPSGGHLHRPGRQRPRADSGPMTPDRRRRRLTEARRGTILVSDEHDTAVAQHLRDLARLRRVRDRIDREYAQPLDVEALARAVHMSAGHLSREFKLAYGEGAVRLPDDACATCIERAMALLRRGDLSVTDVCFAVGCSSLGTFSTRFTELVGISPSIYRRHAAGATAGMPSCVAKRVTRPIRNREAPVTEPQLA